jgi:hypothetical protein
VSDSVLLESLTDLAVILQILPADFPVRSRTQRLYDRLDAEWRKGFAGGGAYPMHHQGDGVLPTAQCTHESAHAKVAASANHPNPPG